MAPGQKEVNLLIAIINGSVRYRPAIIFLLGIAILASGYAIKNSPLDAIPDISDPQIIIYSRWARSAQLLETKITNPLIRSMSGIKGVRTTRGMSYLGYSFVYLIIDNDGDTDYVKSRALGRLNSIRQKLPSDAQIEIGPSASAMGWVYQYVLIDRDNSHDLREIRHLQQERIKPALETVDGVAEVATIGGLEKQYQLKIYPPLLAEAGVSLKNLVLALKSTFAEVGGRTVEVNNRDYQVRAVARAKNIDQLESVVIGHSKDGDPALILDIGYIQVGYDLRRSIADFNGEGEVVGAIVIIERDKNVLSLTKKIKEKLDEIQKTLPAEINIVTAYDRSPMIKGAISTFFKTLAYELVVVIMVMALFLRNARAIIAPALVLSLSVLFTFIPLYLFHQTLNLFSIAGLFLAMGEMADATIVMVENCSFELAEKGSASKAERRRIIMASVYKMARPLFFSLLIIIVSFLPVFFMGAKEGKLFDPLAYGKTFAMFLSTMLTFFFLPGLMLSIFGGARPLPVAKADGFPIRLYRRTLATVLKFKHSFLALNVVILIATIPILMNFEKAFMPELDEGSILFMPTTLPGLPAKEGGWILQQIDKKLKSFPEVDTVFGKLGRGETATDPAPFTMIESTITLRPKAQWREGMTMNGLIEEMDRAMNIPGFVNAWTKPIRGRVDMQITGIQTPVGLKVKGADLGEIESVAIKIEALLKEFPHTKNVFAERISNGYFIDADFDLERLAKRGIRVDDALLHIRYALGGENVGWIEGANGKAPLNAQYAIDYIDTLDKISNLLIVTGGGKATPLSSVATVQVKKLPEMIRDEDGLLTGYIYIDIAGMEASTYVERARTFLDEKLTLPDGYQLEWSGQFRYEIAARKKLYIIAPVTLLIIFALLIYTFRSVVDAIVIILSIPYAFVGGIWLQWALGYPMTIAVWIGYIAVFAVATQTGIIMVIFLRQALEKRDRQNEPKENGDIETAILDGSALRLRPKLMTVCTTLFSLLPMMLSSGSGMEIMKPIATPTVGGMITSTIYVLFIIPCLFAAGARRGGAKTI